MFKPQGQLRDIEAAAGNSISQDTAQIANDSEYLLPPLCRFDLVVATCKKQRNRERKNLCFPDLRARTLLKMADLTNSALHVFLTVFDIDRGSLLVGQHPPLDSLEATLRDMGAAHINTRLLAELMIPEGSHIRPQVSCYFIVT